MKKSNIQNAKGSGRCLQRLVRPRPSMCKAILDGIKPPLSKEVKELVMAWVDSENKDTTSQVPNTAREIQQPKQAPNPLDQAGSECSHLGQECLDALPRSQRTLAEFCIRISYNGSVCKWSNEKS